MLLRSCSFWVLVLVSFTVNVGEMQSSQKPFRASDLHLEADEKTVVRFFYQPALGDYFHAPLVFSVVQEGNPLLNTAPMREAGRTAYISLSEMREMLQSLKRSDIVWEESGDTVTLGSYKKLPLLDEMEILIASSTGMARTRVAPKTICGTLKPLDLALKTPRALWEFQRFQLNYGCKVPGFKYDAYPDH
ncbi:MAG TPA: hypothetical protein VIX91_14970 [Candidatus Acidoferrum sp.]